MKKPKRIVAPFTTEWGHTIQPGQKVFAVTTCSHQMLVEEVEYIGYVKRDGYRYDSKTKIYINFKRPNVQVRRASRENKLIISTLYYNRIIPVESSASELAKACLT